MPTIEEELRESTDPEIEFEDINDDPQPVRRAGFDWEKLKVQTGEGEISDYVNHTLNFNQSRGMARVIRGLTGIIGELNYAMVDIVIGIFDLTKKKKPAEVIINNDRAN